MSLKLSALHGRITAFFFLTLLLAATCLTSACAGRPDPADPAAPAVPRSVDMDDPIEPFNRYMFEVNRFLDIVLLKPVATWYDGITPDPVQGGVRNFLDNLRSPVYLVNTLLQTQWEEAQVVVIRFGINSTIGVAGFFDIASRLGYSKKLEDFGQTLGVWGVGAGPYLYLPILGPSPPRDLAGFVVDRFADPLTYILHDDVSLARAVISGVDLRARNLRLLEQLESTSVDYYATVRNLYLQSRANAIRQRRGDTNDVDYLPDISDLDDDPS